MVAGPDEQTIADYLEKHQIQEHVAQDFWTLPPDVQHLVMHAGSLADARDPTAVLLSRIKKAWQGTLRAMETKPGDWICPMCSEHNFARNTECRACGAVMESPLEGIDVEAFL